MMFKQREFKKMTWYIEYDICCKELEEHISNRGRKHTIQVDWDNGYLLAVGELDAVILKCCPFCGQPIGRLKKDASGLPDKPLKDIIKF